MGEPSDLVPPSLLRHIHLVSSQPFPKLPSFNLELMVEYLIQAPRIVKEQAPMNWLFLNCPSDGDVMLVWQPPQMGTSAASDGYVWADPETAFRSEARGYQVEMYLHRSGYRLPHEAVATHCRRRFRLTQLSNADPSLPPPDSSLWIFHYCQTDPQNRYPSNQIRIPDQIRHSLSERMQLQRHGQLVRKEFMLRDSQSWPTINPPGNPNPQYPQQTMGYPGDVISHMNRSQQQAYMQHQQAQAAQRGIGPSPAKRPRHIPPNHAHGSSTAIPAPAMAQDPTFEDEDGTSGGDYMDFLTPRDISVHRYVQHHEWLEEILNSPYDTCQIIPGELGLGRKGELESLTRDFFHAPIDAASTEAFYKPEELTDPHKLLDQLPVPDTATPRVGRLEAGKAEDFTKRATERVAAINVGMANMKRHHARRMAKLHTGRIYKEGIEILKLSTLEMINSDASKVGESEQHKIDEWTSQMEAHTGKIIVAVPNVECLQQGGLEEKAEPESDHERKETSDQDYDMVDTFGQFNGDTPQAPTITEPQNSDFTQPTIPVNDTLNVSHNQRLVSHPVPDMDNDMQGMAQATRPKETGAEEWIIVNKEGNSAADEDQELGEFNTFANDAAMQSNLDTPNVDDAVASGDLQEFDEAAGDDTTGNFDSNDFGDSIDFGDLGTGGDDLSGYAQDLDDASLHEQGDVGASDNAFGEAFQAPEANVAPDDETSAG